MPAPVSNTNGLRWNDESKGFTFTKLHYVPIFGFTCSFISLFVPYAISVHLGDTPAILPFISDAGGDPPQSIVFGFFLGMTAFTAVIGMWMKYLMVRQQNQVAKDTRVEKTNTLALAGGVLVCLGSLVVALSPTGHLRKDCSWYWPMFVPHMVGAGMLFGSGYATTLMHVYLQYLTDARWKTSVVFYARAVLSVVGITAMLITGFNWLLFDMHLMIPPSGRGKVYPQGMNGAAVAEWVMVIIFQSYVLTYVPEFRKATFVLSVNLDAAHRKKE